MDGGSKRNTPSEYFALDRLDKLFECLLTDCALAVRRDLVGLPFSLVRPFVENILFKQFSVLPVERVF